MSEPAPDLMQLLRALYTDDELLVWFLSPQLLHAGHIPLAMIVDGREDELVASLRRGVTPCCSSGVGLCWTGPAEIGRTAEGDVGAPSPGLTTNTTEPCDG